MKINKNIFIYLSVTTILFISTVFTIRICIDKYNSINHEKQEYHSVSSFYVDNDENFYIYKESNHAFYKFNKNGELTSSMIKNIDNLNTFFVDENGLFHILYYKDEDDVIPYDKVINFDENKVLDEKKVDEKDPEKLYKYLHKMALKSDSYGLKNNQYHLDEHNGCIVTKPDGVIVVLDGTK